MSTRMIPTFHPSPNFYVPPPHSEKTDALHLGSIVTSLQDPIPLNRKDRVAIPEEDVIRSTFTNYTTTFHNESNYEYGIKALILALGNIGAELGVRRGKATDAELHVETLDTEYFNPTTEYLQAVANLKAVETFRKACRDRHPVFLISGLKIAKGSFVSRARMREFGANASVVIPEPLTGLVSVGPVISGGSRKQSAASLEIPNDFVLGYRVTQIWFKGGAVKGKLYTKRATMASDENAPELAPVETPEFDFVNDYYNVEEGYQDLKDTSEPSALGSSRWVFGTENVSE